jgi:hypothetical protein
VDEKKENIEPDFGAKFDAFLHGLRFGPDNGYAGDAER